MMTSPAAAAAAAAVPSIPAATAALMIDFQSMRFSLAVVQTPVVASPAPGILPYRKKQPACAALSQHIDFLLQIMFVYTTH
jgi:hypothetical protein